MKSCENRGGCWTIDEKMGNTYTWHEQANTLASRDYKQPQAVVCFRDDITIKIDGGAAPLLSEPEISKGCNV